MPTSLFQYEMLPTTWFYFSAIITLALFFKFNRFWSVRNFDLITVVLLTPGLLLAAMYSNTAYVWLFGIQGLLVLRLLFDFVMVRRPLLEPNLSSEGFFFSCFFFVFFLIAALIVNRGERLDTVRTVRLEQILTAQHIHKGVGMNPETLTIPPTEWSNLPPGFRPFLVLTERANLAFAPSKRIQQEIVQTSSQVSSPSGKELIQGQTAAVSNAPLSPLPIEGGETAVPIIKNDPVATPEIVSADYGTPVIDPRNAITSPDASESVSLHPPLNVWLLILTLIIGGHLLIIWEFGYIGYCHFGRFQTGIACAVFYLLHPYSSQMIGRLDHVIPAALILFSIMFYRRPFLAGLGIGTAGALVWYPLCLIPLWCGFYRHKGYMRFLIGSITALLVFVGLLWFSLPEWGTFSEQLLHLAGKSAFLIFSNPEGFWTSDDMFYRMPILAIFAVVCVGLLFVPSHKHLATLIGGSALLMLGVQFFQLYQGGLYMSWYLPLLILTVFRPNLENRTAVSNNA